MTESETVIHTSGLTRRFGKLTAVDNLDIHITRGTIYGFLGPNGSGKTTTIRMLAGLLTPSAGKIEVLGLAIPEQVSELKKHMGYMTQRFSLYRDLTVGENLNFVAAVHGLDRTSTKQRIQALVQDYHLEAQFNQRTGTLSGGQQQRLSLAAATIHNPRLLFLDEPTSAVDPQSRRDFWEKLFELSDRGTTILVSTHYMDEAERCHQLAILSAGVLSAQGDPRTMMEEIPAQAILVKTSDPRACAKTLLPLPGIIGVAQIGNQLRVQVGKDINPAADYVSAALTRANIGNHCEKVAANLEDVFVAATRGVRSGEQPC